jgi:hypothetical protein
MSNHNNLTEAGIRAFVDAWYLGLDQHAPTALMGTLVSDDVKNLSGEDAARQERLPGLVHRRNLL